MLEGLKQYYQLAAAKILEVEKELDGKTGEEKQAVVVDYLMGLVNISAIPDFIENPIKRLVFSIIVDKIVEGYNWLSGRSIKSLVNNEETQQKAVVLAAASIGDVVAHKPYDLNDRLNQLFMEYGITTKAMEKAPAPVVSEHSHGLSESHANYQKAKEQVLLENFEKSIAFSLTWEGGKNYTGDAEGDHTMINKWDKGGPTYMGITLPTLKAAFVQGVISHGDMDKLTQDEVKLMYKKNYWDRYSWGDITWPICLACLDCSINHSGFAFILQRAANDVGAELVIDGKYGQRTYNAIKTFATAKTDELAEALCKERKLYYDKLVAKDESQRYNINGWYNRVKDMAKAMGVKSPV